MIIDENKQMHILNAFKTALPSRINHHEWNKLVKSIGSTKETYAYMALLIDEGFLTGTVIFDESPDSDGGWHVNLHSIRITAQGNRRYQYWILSKDIYGK
ncbi:hypothetical protein [Citrobacter europaeus]|uniref:hypothetical protein n=1 Tax=Citrobacter europaeus TaxID=1914243 RepID=UPI0030CE6562